MDVAEPETAREAFFELAAAMDRVELVVLSAGVGSVNHDLEWEPERETIQVNVSGFTAIATAAIEHFERRASASAGLDSSARSLDGHLVGISSVASHVGDPDTPAYNASKAFVTRYLEGLRHRQATRSADVAVTTVEPGYVDTGMAMSDDPFWMSSPETAASQIARAIEKRRSHVYVTRRWRLVSWLVRALPEPIVRRLLS